MRPTRRAATAALLAAVPLLAGCGAGQDATTANYYAPADGINHVQGPVHVLNVLVVAPAQGSSDAPISMTVANDGAQPDTLVGIDAGPVGRAELLGPREIGPESTLSFAGPTAQSSAVIRNFTGRAGETVTLQLTFQRAGRTPPLATVVVPREGYYAGFVVTPTARSVEEVTGGAPTGPSTPGASFGVQGATPAPAVEPTGGSGPPNSPRPSPTGAPAPGH